MLLATAALSTAAATTKAEGVTIDSSQTGREQTIDGFGTCLSGSEGQQAWFQKLYFDDMQCSMLRNDDLLDPRSKWHRGVGVVVGNTSRS